MTYLGMTLFMIYIYIYIIKIYIMSSLFFFWEYTKRNLLIKHKQV